MSQIENPVGSEWRQLLEVLMFTTYKLQLVRLPPSSDDEIDGWRYVIHQ